MPALKTGLAFIPLDLDAFHWLHFFEMSLCVSSFIFKELLIYLWFIKQCHVCFKYVHRASNTLDNIFTVWSLEPIGLIGKQIDTFSLTWISTWFERASMLVILLNCVTLGMFHPCEDIDCDSERCKILEVRIHFTHTVGEQSRKRGSWDSKFGRLFFARRLASACFLAFVFIEFQK